MNDNHQLESKNSEPNSFGPQSADLAQSQGDQTNEWISVKDAAQLAGVSKVTIYSKCKQGELKKKMLRPDGKRGCLINKKSLLSLIKQHKIRRSASTGKSGPSDIGARKDVSHDASDVQKDENTKRQPAQTQDTPSESAESPDQVTVAKNPGEAATQSVAEKKAPAETKNKAKPDVERRRLRSWKDSMRCASLDQLIEMNEWIAVRLKKKAKGRLEKSKPRHSASDNEKA